MNRIVLLLITLALFQCKSTLNNAGTATLENTYWKLAEMNGKPVATPTDSKEVHIILSVTDSEKSVKGFAGCNTLGGNFTTEGSRIHFNTISTKMFCLDRMDIEDFFTNALAKADRYVIKGEELTLYQGDKKLTTLKSVYLK